MEQHLIYYISEIGSAHAIKIETPLGVRYLRVVLYRGGDDPITWGTRNARSHETLLNTIDESQEMLGFGVKH